MRVREARLVFLDLDDFEREVFRPTPSPVLPALPAPCLDPSVTMATPHDEVSVVTCGAGWGRPWVKRRTWRVGKKGRVCRQAARG